MRERARRWLTVAVAVAAFAPAVRGDLKVVRRQSTEGGPGGAAGREVEAVTWIGADRMRADSGETSVIVRLDRGVVLMVDHSRRTWAEIPIPVDVTRYLPEEMRQMVAAMMRFEAKVTPRDETRRVGSWTARRYDLELTSPVMEMRQTVWATKEVAVDPSAYARMVRQVLAMQPGMEALADEMARIEGFPVLQEATVSTMGGTVRTREEVVSVEEAEPPAGWYDPPQGYGREEFDPMRALQRGHGG